MKMSLKKLFAQSHSKIASLVIGAGLLDAGAVSAAIISGTSTTNISAHVTYTQLTINKPAVSVGDVMLASIAVLDGSIVAVTPPSGWTLVARTDNDINVTLISYWKTAGASEPSTYTWTIDEQTKAVGGITPYGGVDTTSPIDAVSGNTGFGTLATTSMITTSVCNEEIIALFTTDVNKTFSTPTGMTQKYSLAHVNAGPLTAAYDVMQMTSGAVTSKSATITGNKARSWSSQQIALRRTGFTCQPTSYWKMDGNSSDSVGGNHGTDTNVAYSVSDGKINQGAGFDGETSGIRLNPLLCGPVNLSATAWVKSTSSTTPSQWIVGQRNSGAMNGQWRLQLDNSGRVSFYAEGGGHGTPDYIHGNTSVNDGNWHNVGVSQNGNTYSFYVDGVADGVVTLGTSVTYDCNLLGSIGFNRFQDDHEQFGGSIDEVGVWNVGLSANDFSQIYNSGAGKQYPF